jgi:murein DD-endopeptidase MepM/ murein hydrolase activator NlpD
MKISRSVLVVSACAAVLSSLALGSSAQAAPADEVSAAARPAFEMPFPCGQAWRAGTRTNHNPKFAIDFNMGGGDADRYKPVVASAAGTATVYHKAGKGYGTYVVINHGGGWSTLYAHLQDAQVKSGQKVAKGQRIARVGKSGQQPTSHLHYEQRLNGNDQRAVLHGVPVYYFGERTLTSKNC